MAKFIPVIENIEIKSEKKVYNVLKNLSDNYYVFHSLKWQNKEKNKVYQGETDFLIYNPSRGIIVLEVKGGIILGKNREFFQINRNTKKIKIIDPLKQADYTKYLLKEKLKELNIPIESAVCFPDVNSKKDISNLPLHYSIESIITKSEMINIESGIKKIYDYYNMNINDPLYKNYEKKLFSVINSEFIANVTLKSIFDDEEEDILEMTEEQIKILDFLEDEKYASISGGAGTGKTTIAIEKAKRISVDDKTLFLCYNDHLAKIFRSKYKDEIKHVDFLGYKGLIDKLSNKKNDNYNDEYFYNLLLDINIENFEYKNIIIDEGQDFKKDQLEILYYLVKEKSGVFYLFYDKNQILNGNLDWINPVTENKLKLNINCRNTRNIAYFSNECITDKYGNVNVKSNIVGDKIEYIYLKNNNKMIEEIIEIIKKYEKEEILLKNISILTLSRMENSLLNEINELDKYKVTTDYFNRKGKILFSSVVEYKGLESDVIILIDVDKNILDIKDIDKLFYVATSRAKHRLHVISTLKIENIPFLSDNLDNIKNIIK